MATSKKPLRVELSPEFRVAIRALRADERQKVGDAITRVQDNFGAPHRHSGIDIRRLRGNVFECRGGLKLRLIFLSEADVIAFTDLETHDDIRKLIKRR